MKNKVLIALFAFLILLPLFAQEKEKNQTKQEDHEPSVKLPADFIDASKEMPPFHLMTEFQNGHVELATFDIPIFRNETIVCSIEIHISLHTKNFKDSLTIYRNRRNIQDRLYTHLYWLFDFAWEQNWHPDLNPIRTNIKNAIEEFNTGKLIEDVFITHFLVKKA